jgi:mono/diheme cytochrome c family protein
MSEVKEAMIEEDLSSPISHPSSVIPHLLALAPRRCVAVAFQNETDLLAAAETLRAAGLIICDAFTPYAVNGLDRSLRLSRSRLGWVCALFGLIGAGLMFWFQHWTSAIDWPLNVGGKPGSSLSAFVPVAFEGAVLAAGLGTTLVFMVTAGLRPGKRARLPFPQATDDQFALLVESPAAIFDVAAVRRSLEPYHAIDLHERTVDEDAGVGPRVTPAEGRAATRRLNIALLISLVLLAAIALLLPRNLARPNREFLPDMAHTLAYRAESVSPAFPDGKTLQAPVAGAIAQGEMPLRDQAVEQDALCAGWDLKNRSAADDLRAQRRSAAVFQNFCTACHGLHGDGDGPIGQRGYPAPPSLTSGNSTRMPDGQLFHIVTYGRGNMPGHVGQISSDDRWNAVGHVRTLQHEFSKRSD